MDINGINDEDMPLRLSDFLNYMHVIKGKSNNTITAYKADLCMFFRFIKIRFRLVPKSINFDDIIINDIDDDLIKKISLPDMYSFIAYVENYRNNSNYAKARKIAALKSLFKYLTNKAKILKENPALELETPKIDRRNPIYLTLEESEKLLSSISGRNSERDYCIITLFLNCGLRLSELCSINISKIKEDTLSVVGKGNKERTIYLNRSCINAIKKYINVRNKYIDKIKDKDALFISQKYGRINKRTVELLVKKYIVLSGLNKDKYTPHKLRHTAATLMYKYGKVDIRSLQKILGHENVSTTQIYTHVDDEELREAVNSNPLNDIK